MEKKLTRVTKRMLFFYKNGKKIEGFPPHVWGNLSGVLLGSGIANGNWISVAVEFGLLNVGLSL